MRAAWAPAYACLYLGLWEVEEVYASRMYRQHMHTWWRYIDDVLMIWKGTPDGLHEWYSRGIVQVQINTDARLVISIPDFVSGATRIDKLR